MMRIGLAALFVCSVAACGSRSGGDDTGDESKATLSIDPPAAELLILNGVDAHQPYTATLTFPDGKTLDVTDSTAFQVEQSFGQFTANDLAVGTAGKTLVYGQHSDKTASAQVIVRLKDVRVDPSLPPTTPDLFTGAEDPALAPTVVYPAPDVIAPRNLGDFETHWTDSHGNDVFEVSLHTEFTDVRVYVPGNNGMAAAGPTPSWSAFTAAEWADAVGVENAVTYQVRGANTASPGPVGAAPPRTVNLTNEPMEGGLYYWASTSTAGAYGIFRHDMSKPGLPAEEYMTTNQTSGRCVACHVLSRDGTKLAVTYDGGNGNATLVDVGTATAQGGSNKWNFGTFSPDGSELITAEQGAIRVRQFANQAVITTMPSSGWSTHPDLSADGKKLVYVVAGQPGSDWSFRSGNIVTRTYDALTHTFGAETPLVTGGGDNYYPSWSPDGEWVLFNRSPSNANAYNATDATLWVVKADGSQPPIQLTVANDGSALTNSWGRWAPFAQTYQASGEKLFWITVSSKRNFGTRLFGVGRPQLWMTPFFPARATAQQDPSAPAFWLPFQNIVSNNHIAQWTERVIVVQ